MAIIREKDIYDNSKDLIAKLKVEINKPIKKLKHQCSNCGATKIESDKCQYCGT